MARQYLNSRGKPYYQDEARNVAACALVGEPVPSLGPEYQCPRCGRIEELVTNVLGDPVCTGRYRSGKRHWHKPTPMHRL